MKIMHDRAVDAAYIYLVPTIAPGAVKRTYPCDPSEVNGEINLDFNAAGHLVGIEVLGASRKLSMDLLNEAELSSSSVEALKRG